MNNNLFESGNFQEVLEDRIKFVQEVYLQDDRPWVIGYSGGKDSTVITDLVIDAIARLGEEKRQKPIFVISSDTMVENPMIESYIIENLNKINEFCKEKKLNISAHHIYPEIEDSFWVGLIGKGYPAPNQKLRWCTDRLKIKPANKFVKSKVDQYGEVVMVLGVRSSESISRAQTMEKHRVEGKVLRKHSNLQNALVFAPIEDLTTDDVWTYLLRKNPNTWGTDNAFLMSLYQDSQDGECPLMVDKEKPSCGNSRFGCWTCTVVQKDKSLTGFLKTASKNRDKKTVEKLKTLIDIRDWLVENRNELEYRETKRQNGNIYRVETKEGSKEGLGAYNFKAKKKILSMVLNAQRNLGVELIKKKELELIQEEWNKRIGDLENSVNNVWKEIYGEDLFQSAQSYVYNGEDLELLEELCNEEDIDIGMIKRLLKVEQKYYGYTYRKGIYKEMDSILNEEWFHKDKIEEIKFGEKNENK